MGIERSIDLSRPPLFIGAGIINVAEKSRQYSAIPDIAVQVFGSISMEEHGGNDSSGQKRIFYYDEDHGAAYNAVGLRNAGRLTAGKELPDCINRAHIAGQALLIAITSLKHEDPVDVLPKLAEWAAETGADGIELNLSCPNEGSEELLCMDIEKSLEVVAEVRERVGWEPYILAKVSALNKRAISQYVKYGLGVDGITSLNNELCLSPLDPATGKRVIEVNDGYAGRGGPLIAPLARENLGLWENVHDLHPELAEAGQYDIWSIGGVTGGREVYDRTHLQGAYMVGAAQAFYRTLDPAALAKQWRREYWQAAVVQR